MSNLHTTQLTLLCLDFCPHAGVDLRGITNISQILQSGKSFFIGIDGWISEDFFQNP